MGIQRTGWPGSRQLGNRRRWRRTRPGSAGGSDTPFLPGVSNLKLGDVLAVIRELRAVLPTQQEFEELPPIQINVVAGGPVVPYRPEEERHRS